MKKIIIKNKLENSEVFEKKLEDIEVALSPIYWQHDRIYVPRGYKTGMNLPRLIMRTEMKAVDRPAKYTLILKRHIEDSGIDVVAETVVKDYTETIRIILQLGFEQKAEISKTRQEAKMDDKVMLYLDHVEGKKGYYAKIETELAESDKVAVVREDLTKTIKMLNRRDAAVLPYFEI